MPIITVTLIEGYDRSLRTALATALTRTACTFTGADPDGVTVVVNEVAAENYMRGGRHRTPGRPPRRGGDIVQDYLAAMEARDLDKARDFLAEDFTMIFPGGRKFHTLEELRDWAATRYRRIAKDYEQFDEIPGEGGSIVYCHGTLHGEFPDGTAFSGIRFIDRFEIAAEKLTRQQVWNDLGEHLIGR